MSTDRQVQFGAPGRGAAQRSLRGRVCESVGCTTVLSVYNHLGTCSVHEMPSMRTAGNRKTSI